MPVQPHFHHRFREPGWAGAEAVMAGHTFTPGPWVVDDPVQPIALPSITIYAPYGNGHLVATLYTDDARNQTANARLISAAPDLYTVVHDLARSDRDLADIIDAAHEALAKIEATS